MSMRTGRAPTIVLTGRRRRQRGCAFVVAGSSFVLFVIAAAAAHTLLQHHRRPTSEWLKKGQHRCLLHRDQPVVSPLLLASTTGLRPTAATQYHSDRPRAIRVGHSCLSIGLPFSLIPIHNTHPVTCTWLMTAHPLPSIKFTSSTNPLNRF